MSCSSSGQSDALALAKARSTRQPIYAPADALKKQFRLLKILPGCRSSPIRCILTRYALPDAPAYSALSYAWGQPDPDCHIEVDSCLLSVTKNLLRFLKKVRELHGYADHYFWIDAICVNQSDIEERGQQVGMMTTIYTSATLVILWLGPAYEESDLAMRALATLSTMSEDSLSKLWFKREGAALRRLCERRYWTRLWVLQELALAKSIHVICGARQVRWENLTSFALGVQQPLFRNKAETSYTYKGFMESPGMAMIKQVIGTSAESLLCDQVRAAQHLRCLDPRDKVYGVLGIAKLDPLDSLIADYSITVIALVHRILQQELAVRPASSLLDVRERCLELANVFDIPVHKILSSQDVIPVGLTEEHFLDEGTGISLLWAVGLKLRNVAEKWFETHEYHRIAAVLATAIEGNAIATINAVIGIWQEYPFALDNRGETDEESESLGGTPLHVAATCGNSIALRILLDSGIVCTLCKEEKCCHGRYMCAVNQPDKGRMTALHRAIRGGHRAVVEMILAIDIIDLDGTTNYRPAFRIAINTIQNFDEGVFRLLMNRSDVNILPFDILDMSILQKKRFNIPILAAVDANSISAVQILLTSTELNIDARCEEGYTALHHAAKHLYRRSDDGGDASGAMTMLLLDRGCDVNARNKYLETPLHLAARVGNAAVMMALLEHGADSHARDGKGVSPLELVVERAVRSLRDWRAEIVVHGYDAEELRREKGRGVWRTFISAVVGGNVEEYRGRIEQDGTITSTTISLSSFIEECRKHFKEGNRETLIAKRRQLQGAGIDVAEEDDVGVECAKLLFQLGPFPDMGYAKTLSNREKDVLWRNRNNIAWLLEERRRAYFRGVNV